MYKSQSGQDKFIVNILKGKEKGYFLEIGSCHPININNTFILEKIFSWKGIMIEYSDKWLQDYKNIRKNSIHIINDARKINYKKLLLKFPKNIDYLQIDIDVANGSTIETLEKLDNEIMDLYKFAVITFEHDYYCARQYKYTRELSRTIFRKHKYLNVFEDINDNNPNIVFEDWWVHPDLVDIEYVKQLKNENINNYKKNILTNLSINWKDIIYPNEIQIEKNIIKIGNSKTNTKILELDKIYPSNTKLTFIYFIYNYKDTFSYNINGNKLIITRTDEECGWGQDLVAYLSPDDAII